MISIKKKNIIAREQNSARNRVKAECMKKITKANPEFIKLQNERNAMMHTLNGFLNDNKESSVSVMYDLDIDLDWDMYNGIKINLDFDGNSTHEECDETCTRIIEDVKRIYDQRKKIINMKKEYKTIYDMYKKEKEKYDRVVKFTIDEAITELEKTFV